jgi:methionine-rich copper-binding protein CopC
MKIRRLILALVLVVLLVPAAAAHAASIWTPISSGTTDTISSIVYQSPTRFWYATTNGKIEYFNGSSFVAGAGITAGENFTDLAFQPTSVPGGPGTSGLYGYAVASNGDVWQTFNGGVSWTPVPPPLTPSDCSNHSTTAAETELNAVVWSSSSTVYLLGDNSTLAKSSAANTPTPAFAEINKNGSGTCAAQSDTSAQNLTDATFLPTNPLDGFMISQDFGSLYATSNGFASGIKKSEMVNNFQGSPRLAQDPANPNRLWAVDHAPGGGGCDELCLQFSTDGGVTDAHATFPNDSTPSVGLYDISSHGGTEVAAGSGGEIFNSIDGSHFYLQPAGGALATEDWRAEDAFDAQHAAVGGIGGALAVTAQANAIHGILPPAGLRPTTVSTGGATITTYSTVIVTGRTQRYVPVKLSAQVARRVVVTILTLKGHHQVAFARVSVGRHGRKTIHVALSRKVKAGKYFIVIRVVTPTGHPVGRKLSVKFKLV